MGASDSLEQGLAELLFLQNDYSPVALNDPAQSDLYLGLHTASPGDGGTQDTNEATYTSYARVTMPRDASTWSVVAGVATNLIQVQWPTSTGGTETITHWSIGKNSNGPGTVFFYGAFASPLTVTSGMIPTIAPGALALTFD